MVAEQAGDLAFPRPICIWFVKNIPLDR
jgi:hypothetical protein